MVPVAKIYTPFSSKFGIPRQSGLAGIRGKIVFEPAFRSPEAVRGIEGFSHLWLIWEFSEAKRNGNALTVRPPRLGGNERVGVFASRSPYRPNSLGLSCVKLIRVGYEEQNAPVLYVEGADMLSGTPIFDIKPYLPFTDSIPDASGGFADEVKDQSAEVTFCCDVSSFDSVFLTQLSQVLSGDPRPHYQNDPERVYSFEFGGVHVGFVFSGKTIKVTRLEPQS
ncbi:MAG: tRNA (N6-threonylcarbamoyladenosine(37)-N6)-methyltransferase TrmO [Clostridia bacterium]|nr:tRNA (N6-threonylcarbamoyladenosine(37)-N6)-methyltransferase TrmO [Clostridia bacterium]